MKGSLTTPETRKSLRLTQIKILTAKIGELSPYLRLLRPELYYMDLTLPASSAILASYLATGGLPEFLTFLSAVIGGFAAITSSYVFNDCCDIDIDTINLPDRPLPSSRVSKNSALAYALFLLGVAGAAAAYLNPESLFVLFIAAGEIPFSASYQWVFHTGWCLSVSGLPLTLQES